jgi:heavy metal sensor kinase
MMIFGFSSIRAKLTVFSSVVLGGAILLFSIGIYLLAAYTLRSQVRSIVDDDFKSVVSVLRHEIEELEELDEHSAVNLFAVFQGDETVYATSGWRSLGIDRDRLIQKGETYRHWRSGEGSLLLRMESAPAPGKSFLVVVATDETAVESGLRSLALILALCVPMALALSLWGGYLLAGRLLAPISEMANRARRITADSLDERLPVENPSDELGLLATSFNDALARLQDAFDRLRRFTSDASHELRTPLTAIRSVGEVALREDLRADAYRDTIGSMLEEVDRLVRLVENLLTLTRGDSGRWVLQKQPTDLTDFAESVVEDLSVLAEEKGQTLEVDSEGAVWTEIDSAVLRQALINLIDNAVKHTPKGGTIRAIVKARSEEEALIEVVDQGPGIPAEHRASVFERFVRVDLGRSTDAGGTGLGLSIAKWAVEANGGRIELEGEPGQGSIFRIVLPTVKRM